MVNNLPANAGDLRDVGLTPQSKKSPGEGNGNPLQYPCLKNPMDRGAWRAIVHSVKESNTHAGEIRQSMLNQVGKSE